MWIHAHIDMARRINPYKAHFAYIYIYGAYPGAHQNNILQEIDARFFLMFFAIYIYGAYPGAHQFDARFFLMFYPGAHRF